MKKTILGIYEIAQYTNVSKPAVVNWRNRYHDFPKPIAELKSGPIYNTWEIELWLKSKPDLLEEFKKNLGGTDMVLGLRFKRIAIVGRSRTGKSRILSRFLKFKALYDTYFTRSGEDFTDINIEVHLYKELPENGNIIRFESTESSINGNWESFDEDGVKEFFKNARNNDVYLSTHEKANQPREGWNPKTDKIIITTLASEFALTFMKDLDNLIVIDTPGVSGEVEGLENLSSIDVFILAMKSDNKVEFAKSIRKMLPTLAGARILYVFGDRPNIINEKLHAKAKETAKQALLDFVSLLEDLKTGSILEDSLEVLNPQGYVIPMGAFTEVGEDYEYTYSEECFDNDLKELLDKLLNEDVCTIYENNIADALVAADVAEQQSIIDYIMTILEVYRTYPSGQHGQQGTYKNAFLLKGYDRVKSNGSYEIPQAVAANRKAMIDKLYSLYNNLQVNPANTIDSALQITIIKYCFFKLSDAIKKDCGISRGNHVWEDCPPITMWAEESVIASEILKAQVMQGVVSFNNVFMANGYTSKSWNCVDAPVFYQGKSSYLNEKLEIIHTCNLIALPSANLQQLIHNAYNLALFKLGQYSVCEFLINTTNATGTPMAWVAKLK